jgi:hypothetical protein
LPRNCHPKYWSSARFAVEVVEATSRAIDIVKADAGKQGIELIRPQLLSETGGPSAR